MTMKELAEKIGVSESAISQYENGKRQPGYDTLIELTKIFDVTADYLLGIEADDDAKISKSDKDMLEAYKNAASESDFVAYMESTAIAQINARRRRPRRCWTSRCPRGRGSSASPPSIRSGGRR